MKIKLVIIKDMKTILSILFATLLTLCGCNVATSDNKEVLHECEKVCADDENLVTCENMRANCYEKLARKEKTSEKCFLSDERNVQNECLISYMYYLSYSTGELPEDMDKICSKIEGDDKRKSECYQYVAFTQENISLCANINVDEKELSEKYCENVIVFKNEGAQWYLDSYRDTPVYKGNAYLKGWIVDVPIYIGPETKPHFHVADESTKLLPFFAQDRERYDFVIINDDKEKIIDELRNYGPENPATILTDNIIFRMEGSPIIHILKIDPLPRTSTEIEPQNKPATVQ